MRFKKDKTELLNFSNYLLDKGFNMKFVVFKDEEQKANSTNGGKLIEKLLIELGLEKQDLSNNLKITANGVSRTLKRLKNGEGTIKTLKNYITAMNCFLFIAIERINDKKIFSKITSYDEAIELVKAIELVQKKESNLIEIEIEKAYLEIEYEKKIKQKVEKKYNNLTKLEKRFFLKKYETLQNYIKKFLNLENYIKGELENIMKERK